MSESAKPRMRRMRQKILAAAEDVFLSAGFLGASMDQVAEKAGVSKQTIYAHFRSKQALFVDVVATMAGGAAQALEAPPGALSDDRPVGVFLHEAASEQLAVVLTPRLMQLRRMVIGEVERFPDLGRTLYENGPQKAIDRLARAFARYTENGQLYAPDPVEAAQFFNWMVMGGPTSAAMLLGEAGLPDEQARQRHVQESVRIFLSAYGAGARPAP